jgi:hypothetical protein
MTMELELTVTLDDDAKGEHCSQFSFSVDYDGDGVENAFLCSASPKFKIEVQFSGRGEAKTNT